MNSFSLEVAEYKEHKAWRRLCRVSNSHLSGCFEHRGGFRKARKYYKWKKRQREWRKAANNTLLAKYVR